MQPRVVDKNLRSKKIALAVALTFATGGSAVFAQSTSGSIYGTADPGAQVSATNEGNGSARSVTVGKDGRYQFNSLLPGTYKVALVENGKTGNQEVTVVAGQGANVNLATATAAAAAQNLSTISVTANSMAAIDVSSVQTNTVITAQQMKELPIPKNVTAIALLTPGASKGDSAFGNLASFGGASVAENAYYVNGFNVTNQFDSLSFSQVPFEAIDQESVQDGGYGAEYGNATGGVVSVQTKRGTNEWHGGVDITWNPSSMMADDPNVYLNDGHLSYNATGNKNASTVNNNSASFNPIDFTSRWNAWIGGPLVKDKLFVFALVSQTKTDSDYYDYVDQAGGGGYQQQTEKDPYWLLKLDWNINDSNILEYTGFNDTRHYSNDVYYSGYDNDNPYHYDYQGVVKTKAGGQTNILKYTSYITDDLTLTAQYGDNKNKRYQTAIAADGTVESYDNLITSEASGCPQISDNRNPVLAGTLAPYSRCSFVPGGTLTGAPSNDSRKSFRLDLEYKLGDHDITGGWSRDVTTSFFGQAYEGGALWNYEPDSSTSNGDPDENYVQQIVYNTGAKVSTTERAAYLQDNWHITDNFLARIGVRNDQFNNQNGNGQTYVKQDHNLQPRMGFAWDVHGDSSLKIYGSAGDYSLPIDAGVAVRGAAASIYSVQNFSYTGVNATTGAPTGLTALGPVFYENAEAGVEPNPVSYAVQGLKPFKQREFILGAQQQWDDWTFGVKGIVRRVLTGIDDECDFRPIAKYADSVYGFDYSTTSLTPALANGDAVASTLNGCFINNPGDGATLYLPLDPNNPGKLYKVQLSGSQIGEPNYKRGYYAMELTADRNFNNEFYLNISYTLARSYGNTEGLVDSNIGQADTGTSELFDYPEIMYGTNGNETNDHRHTVKAYGAWRISDQWQVGANFIVQTGRPENCYGDAPIDATIGGYGDNGSSPYMYCYVDGVGEYVTRGSAGTTPTLWQLDLNGSYHPNWLKGLSFRATVFNVFNRHTPLSVSENQNANQGATLYTDTTYLTATSYQTPRYLQLSAEYDF
ncbi:TonB-dependent receptor [Dyella mobilis]|uniref:TonB-dependent receptor n=1 Tax=Dyella mobilis TaxID=1849582 RepID=A0ABS2KET5_9GAMM|nr:TonB-dependent receptor [Dyella mobilis]MBM7129686.1 TonB-dependent receptor [Dyella mobilis]GLQ98048.1 Oar protein [Dyella mobilis]